MGILCQSCNSLKIIIDPEKANESNKQPENDLPRQYLNIQNEENKTPKEETSITQKKSDDNYDFLKKKAKSARIKEDIKNNENNENNENYSKSKSMKIERTSKKSHSLKLVIEDKKKVLKHVENYMKNKEKRANSLTKPKKYEDFDYNILFKKKNLDKNQKNNLKISQIQVKSPIFKRKQKKSTTLMENSSVLKQLFLVQMSIPVSQELLVMHQKGNPNDKYIRGKKLGSGTFGVVYEAKNKLFNNKVAMKVIKKNENMDNLLIKNEIDILKKLSHPNIVRIYEFYETNNNFYLINEYCDGGELFNYINNSKLNEQQLSILFYQVFSGLCYLHENNILHRDLKPENILISKIEKIYCQMKNIFGFN